MSQDTFPFAAGEEAPPFAEEGERNRKAVLVAGAVISALIVAAAAWFFLSGSSDTTTSSAFVPTKVRPAAVAPKKVATKPAKKLPAPYTAKLGRDPFRALYVVPVAATVIPTTPTSTGSTSTSTSGSSGSSGSSGTTPGTSVPGTTRYPLKLVAISTPKPGEVRYFTWLVDGKNTVVIPAQRFGKVGELVVLAYGTNTAGKVTGAVIQVGDDSPIEVLIGETVSVL